MSEISSRRWTLIGLTIALFALPIVLTSFDLLFENQLIPHVVTREIILFANGLALLFIVKKKERLDWGSIGLSRPRFGNFALWAVTAFLGVLLAIPAGLLLQTVIPWSWFKETVTHVEAQTGLLVLLIACRRAFVEELFYRAFAIERLRLLTGRMSVAVVTPLLVFTLSYYRDRWDLMLVAFRTGMVLSGVYLYNRNFWVIMVARFLGDPTIVTLSIPIVASFAITLMGGDGITVSPRSVILKQKYAPQLVKGYAQDDLQNATQFWTPSLAQAQEMENRLPYFIKEKTQLGRPVADDYKQYVGVISNGKRLIFVAAFHAHEYDKDLKLGWKHRPLIVAGGGSDFWQILYDPETKQFDDFQINGPM